MIADPVLPIDADNTWLLWSIILGGVALSIHLEQTRTWAARLSGPVLGLLLAMTLSTVGIMPTSAPVYDFVGDYLIPMAIPLLLLRANVVRIVRRTGKMFLAFHLSVFGTVVGALTAVWLLGGNLDHAPEIAGIMTASYSGGSVNFFAVLESYRDVVAENQTNPLLVADNFVMAGIFMILLLLAGARFMLARFPHPTIAATHPDRRARSATGEDPAPRLRIRDVALALAIAFAVATLARECAEACRGDAPGEATFWSALAGNHYVWITLLSLTLASVLPGPLEKIQGAEELGSYTLYIYLFTIGLPANLLVVLGTVPAMFAFCGVMAVVNLLVTLSLGRLCRLDLEHLLIAVNATLGGPPSAMAMATSKGWSNLVAPAMLIGIWGYVIGTAVGIATTNLIRSLGS